jgi:hypothetical protein
LLYEGNLVDIIEISDLIATGGLIGTTIGLAFTAWQIRKNTKTERGKFFKELYEPFFFNNELRYVFELIEKKENIFGAGHGTADGAEREKRQKAIENLFAHFEILCSLYRRGLINKVDMQNFDYNIQRVFKHTGFSDYEKFLDSWWKGKRLLRGPYSSFFWYVNKNREKLES